MLITTVILLVFYAFIMLLFAIAWRKLVLTKSKSQNEKTISVIVAARNEAHNIPNLLESISQQNYPRHLFEIILVDDHSSDETVRIAKQINIPNLLIEEIPESFHGKKAALKYAAYKAKGELLLFTDADCTMGANWISSFADAFEQSKVQLIAGPVMISGKAIWEEVQALEFMSLVHSGAGAIASQKPIMLNGANLCIRKSTYLKHIESLNETWRSGDDMFLMLSLKKEYPRSIYFLKNKKAIVTTQAQPTFSSFFAQRARWAGKASAYRDFWVVFVSALIMLTNLWIIFTFLFKAWNAMFLALTVKTIADSILLIQATKFYNRSELLVYIIPLQLIYPFYVLISIALTTFPVTWKGRKLRS